MYVHDYSRAGLNIVNYVGVANPLFFFLMKGFVLVVLNWPAVLKVKLLILEATTNKNASGMLKLRATPVQWPPKKSFRTILKVC